MKVLYSFCVTVILLSFLPISTEPVKLAVEPNHSTIQFSIPISGGLTRVTGKFTDFTIDIDYVDNDLTKSTMMAVIKATSINTGIPDRDDHLRTADFFEVETYPEITFVSDSIVKTNDEYVAFGSFQMHGITKALQMPFRLNGKDGKFTLGITSRLSLNRSDYNLGTDFKHTSIENFLGDQIAVEIDFWTKKRKDTTP